MYVQALYGLPVNHVGYSFCDEHTYKLHIEAVVSFPCFVVIVREGDTCTADLLVWGSLQ